MKKFKVFAAALAICAVSVTAGGCSDNNKVGKWFDQLLCTHEWDDGEVTKEATCASKGEIKYTCESCEKTKTKKTDKLPHTEVEIEMEATCSEEGLTDGVKCAVCDEVLQQPKVVAKIAHFEVPNSEAVAATCTTAGLKPGTHCARCDEVITTEMVIPALGHSDADGDGLCDVCGENILTGSFTEVAAEAGELVANNWYRIYRGELYNSNTLNLSGQSYCNFFYSKDYPSNFLFGAGPLWRANMHVVETEEYIDLYMGVGTYMLTNNLSSDGCKFVIDETTTINSMNNESAVYRLVGSVDPHTDADGDDICDVCKDGTAVAEAGEVVADNVYRVYFDELGSSRKTTMKLSAFDDGTYLYLESSSSATAYLWWSGDSGPLYYLEGMTVVKTDDYFQVTFFPGTYRILKSDGTDTGDTVTIDETTTISSIEGIVRRIVVSDDHTCDIVTNLGVAATCTTDGFTSFKVCSLCGTVYEGREVIPATGHTDKDEDGVCDVCLDGAVIVSSGELIADNTYRFYAVDTVPNVYFSWDDSDTYFYIAGEKNYVWWSGYSGPYGYLEGLTVVKTDDYLQVTFLPGTYKILKSDGTDTGDTVTIDETTTISRIYNVTVYRIPNA